MIPKRFAEVRLARLALAAWSVLTLHAAVAQTDPHSATQHFEHDGVAVEYSLLPATPAPTPAAPMAGEAARVRFTLTDTTSGKPLTRLHPAAWLSKRDAQRPQSETEKVKELLGGSILSKAAADFNSFRVLTLNADASVSVVDPLFGFGGTKLLAMIPLPGIGTDWTLAADGTLLFVSATSAGKLAVIDTATWKTSATLTPCAGPGRLALQPDAHYLWVDCSGEVDDAVPGVAVVSADRPAIVAHIATGQGAHEMAFSADSHWAFVTNPDDGTLSVIDVRTLKKVRDVALDGHPTDMAYSRLSNAVYITDEAKNTVIVVDAAKQEVVARIPAAAHVAQIRFAPGDRYALITAPKSNLVLILDGASNRIVQRAGIDKEPEQIAFSSDMAFVSRRGSASVSMIPLKEIGREGQPVAVAEFVGGEHPLGAPTLRADTIVAAPGEAAVVVANPQDKAVYYYMEGMAAPMGNFGNYDHEPHAVLVLDRSLREVAPGVYETTATLPAAGDYDALFFLSAPRTIHAFDAAISANPALAAQQRATLRLTALPNQTIVPGKPAHVRFRLGAAAQASTAPATPDDLSLLAVLAPGTWHQRANAQKTPDGSVSFDFTPPGAGLYYFYAESPTLGATLDHAPCLVIHAIEPPAP